MVVERYSMRFVKMRQHNEEQNLTSYAIRSPSKIHDKSTVQRKAGHQDLRKAKRGQKVLYSGINQSLRRTDAAKRKLAETMSNEEWIKAIEMKIKKKNNKLGSRNPLLSLPPRPSLAEEFERVIINEYGRTRIMRVIQKSLSSTNVSKGHSRVFNPCSRVESLKFLDDDEMSHLRNQ